MRLATCVDDAVQDFRYAVRTLRRSPGFTAIAVLTLALGIGANTAIFSVVNAVLLRPLPYKNPDRLFRIFGTVDANGGSGPARRVPGVSVADLDGLRARTQTLSHVSFYVPLSGTLAGHDGAVRVEGARLSPETFPMLGAQALIGRVFEARETAAGADVVVVLSFGAWQRYFAATPNVLGQTWTVDDRTYTVIGVMPPSVQFPDRQTEFWVPFVAANFPMMGGSPIVRLKDGVSVQAATAEVSTILQQLRVTRPARGSPDRLSAYELVGVQDLLVAPVRPALLLMIGAVGFVLLIACANVANLLLARTAARRREIAVRLAIGASRARLVRQALTESVVLSLAGGAGGSALAFGGVRLLRVLAAGLPRRDINSGVALPRLDEIGIDATVFTFTLAVSVVTGLIFGLAPAMRACAPKPMDTLRAGAASGGSGFSLTRGHRAQGLLVVIEIAMATMLFVGGALLVRSVINLSRVDPGYDPSHVLTAQVTLPRGRYAGTPLTVFGDDLTARIQRVPGVVAAGYARQLPMIRIRQLTYLRTTPEMPAALPPPPPFDGRQRPQEPDTRVVSREYLKAMGVRVVAGRSFDDGDSAGRKQVMLINQTLARSGLFGSQPIGRQIYALGRAPWEIVGIVEDVRQFELNQDPDPQIFVDYRQEPPPSPQFASAVANGPPPAPYFAVRTKGDPLALASTLRGFVRAVEPNATVDNIATMEQLVASSLSRPRLYAVLLGIFAAVAVLLTAIGIYGVMAYAVAQRVREIGIRMALGAQRRDVMGLVLRQSVVLTAFGITAGLAGAFGVTRYLDTLLFGLTALDPATFIVVPAAFAAVATCAALVPARRATRVDPLVALRCE